MKQDHYLLQVRISPPLERQVKAAAAMGLKPTELTRFLLIDFIGRGGWAADQENQTREVSQNESPGANHTGAK